MYRNRPVSSLVDYVISNIECYDDISNMCVLDTIHEYSDHCPLTFSLSCCISDVPNEYVEFEKIVWNSSENDLFLNILQDKCSVFNEINQKLLDGVYDIDQCMKSFSDTVYDISFACYGKTYNNRPKQKKSKSLWFNDDCKYAKKLFCDAKRRYANIKSEDNKIYLLNFRKQYITVKRSAKGNILTQKKLKCLILAKRLPASFGSILRNFEMQIVLILTLVLMSLKIIFKMCLMIIKVST